MDPLTKILEARSKIYDNIPTPRIPEYPRYLFRLSEFLNNSNTDVQIVAENNYNLLSNLLIGSETLQFVENNIKFVKGDEDILDIRAVNYISNQLLELARGGRYG